MEVGGFAVGAVALASLFKDCADLYSMFTSAQNLDKDAATLQAKLEIEETVFLRWPERVGLFKQDQDQNEAIFSDAHTRRLIMLTLEQMRDLLSDGNKLRKLYGVKSITPAKESNSSLASNDVHGRISARRRLQFDSDFRGMNIKDVFKTSRISMLDNFAKQITWVIGDKQKFHQLISDLTYFNRRLVELTPGSTPALTANDLCHIRNIEKFDVIVEALQNNHSHQSAVIEARSNAIQSRILDTLWFRWHDDRRLTVKDAHKKTFRWSLDSSAEDCTWQHLPTWLKSNSGIYWLAGKAGSGKSTLMKFIHSDERTMDYLEAWSGDSDLVVANFFFFAQGYPEQKSQVGLLRSLLHQLLSHDATLAEIVLPNAWREASRENQKKQEGLTMPSIAEMEKALEDICNLYRATKKIFFLIDGIDEYEGNDIDVAALMSALGAFSNVKILVSSRPHDSLVAAFRESPRMNLPDLTERDISHYVYDTVAYHPYMIQLSAMNPETVELITKSIVERASGVFLWVVLVCRSVIEGCDAFETASDLQSRVDESPKEIEELLNHILQTIDPRWEDEAMKIMYLVHTNQSCGMAPPLSTLGLSLICEQGYISDMHSSEIRAREPFTTKDTDPRCSTMEGRLRSRCRGLVEVNRVMRDKDRRRFFGGNDENKESESILMSSVEFMHRTVYDFLSQPCNFNRWFGKITQQGFNAYFVLCNLWCQLIPTFQQNKAVERMHCLFGAVSITIYGNYKGCALEVIFHCFSRIQYICGMYLIDDNLPKAAKYFVHDRNCRQYYSDISVILALAAECSVRKTIEFVYETEIPLHSLLYQPPSLESLRNCEHEQDKRRARSFRD
ncbi:hypothetical protein FPSE_03987 [Fusarium pseudograminearum CS3096]|uniref:NACHT domain-containing protein n=1 Tax=Fusarium pseudograminearum (strain CS3096) TaxID=1028729 RepID=K3VLN9_FUSPC|nr:hypothetical protein FPSE_03987 [Fusarium pseudograminearum CS3096]EKJ75807.1 hypothetical protein FPSE_03987 [Fusarium pseudograminearum CS3096]